MDQPIQQSRKEMRELEQQRATELAEKRNKAQAQTRREEVYERQDMEDPDAQSASGDQPKSISKIGFILMLILAIIKDVGLDMLPASVFALIPIGTIIYFLAWMIGYLIIAIIYIWAWSKGGGKKEYQMFLWLIGTICAESIPLLKDVATSLIFFVIWVYVKNTKEVGKFKELSAGAAKSAGLITKALKYIPK